MLCSSSLTFPLFLLRTSRSLASLTIGVEAAAAAAGVCCCGCFLLGCFSFSGSGVRFPRAGGVSRVAWAEIFRSDRSRMLSENIMLSW